MNVSRRAFLTMAGSAYIARVVHDIGQRVTPAAERAWIDLSALSLSLYDRTGALVGSRFAIPRQWVNGKAAFGEISFAPITVSAWDGPACVLEGIALFSNDRELLRAPINFSYASVTPGDVICFPHLLLRAK